MDSYDKRNINVTGGTRGIGKSENSLIDGKSFCEIDKIKLAQRLLGKIRSTIAYKRKLNQTLYCSLLLGNMF